MFAQTSETMTCQITHTGVRGGSHFHAGRIRLFQSSPAQPLRQASCLSLGLYKVVFQITLYWACYYLAMLGFKLIRLSTRGSVSNYVPLRVGIIKYEIQNVIRRNLIEIDIFVEKYI